MKLISLYIVNDVLEAYKTSYVIKSKNCVKEGNIKKSQIYNAKVNAIQECINAINKLAEQIVEVEQ